MALTSAQIFPDHFGSGFRQGGDRLVAQGVVVLPTTLRVGNDFGGSLNGGEKLGIPPDIRVVTARQLPVRSLDLFGASLRGNPQGLVMVHSQMEEETIGPF